MGKYVSLLSISFHLENVFDRQKKIYISRILILTTNYVLIDTYQDHDKKHKKDFAPVISCCGKPY